MILLLEWQAFYCQLPQLQEPRSRSGLAIGIAPMKMDAGERGECTKCENKLCGTGMTQGYSHHLLWILISRGLQASFPPTSDGPHSETEAEC